MVILCQACLLHNGKGSDYHRDGRHPCQCHQLLLAEEIGYERRADEDDAIQHKAEAKVNYEGGIVVIVRTVVLADECRTEPAIDEGGTYCRKYGDDAYQSVIVRTEQSRQHNADHKRHRILGDIIHRRPAHTFYCFIF